MINFKCTLKYGTVILPIYLIWCYSMFYFMFSGFNFHSIGINWSLVSESYIINTCIFIILPGILIFKLFGKKFEPDNKLYDLNLDFTKIKEKLIGISINSSVFLIAQQVSILKYFKIFLLFWTIINISIYFNNVNNGISEKLKKQYFVSIFSPDCCPKCHKNPDVCHFRTFLRYYDNTELIFYVLSFGIIYFLIIYLYKENNTETSASKKLIKLKGLLESNLISEEEYNTAKQKILSEL